MIVLASASPRRRELLAQVAIPCTVRPASIDEAPLPYEPALGYVRRVALAKAHAVAKSVPEATVLAADTTVELEGTILNKPRDLQEAERMLRQLANRTHQVHTGVAVLSAGHERFHAETTSVYFASIPPEELAVYLASGDPLDKAGAYGIQGYAARWIPRVEGDFFNVVGLPLAATVRLLREAGALSSLPSPRLPSAPMYGTEPGVE